MTEITRLSRSRCDAFIAVGGLPAGEKMPGFESLTRMLSAGKTPPEAPQKYLQQALRQLLVF